MPGRHHLFVPGPANVPDRVLRAMAVPMEDHRSPRFPELTLPLFDGLKKVFRTQAGSTFILQSTGTGAWEACLTNMLSPGDKVLAPRFGQFSHLWIEMAKRHGLEVEILDEEWGTGVDCTRVEDVLRKDGAHTIKAVLAVHNETATGVTSNIADLRRAMDGAHHPALLMVDGISSIGSLEFRMDDWRVDAAITGSQKGMMLPTGQAYVALSPRAMAMCGSGGLKHAYLNFQEQAKVNATGYFPYTPSIPMLYGLREALAMIMEEGLDQIVARHHRLAGGVRAAVSAWGLQTCAKGPDWHSDTVTAVMVANGAQVMNHAYQRYQISFGAGLAQVAGKLFRIGHLGDLNEVMVLGALAGAEMALLDCGVPIEAGRGVAAAQRHYRESAAKPALQSAA